MNNMIGQLRWYHEGSDDPDVEEDIPVELAEVYKDGSIEIAYPDSDGRTYLRFSLRDLMEQLSALKGAENC